MPPWGHFIGQFGIKKKIHNWSNQQDCRSKQFFIWLCRSTVPSLKNHVWTSLMTKHWGIWWTLLHMQAGDQWGSGPTRPAPSLASVLHTSKHSVSFFLWSYTLLCASRPDLWGKHLSFLGNGDPAVPDWSMFHSLRHFPALPASTDCFYQHLLWRRQSAHSQGPLHQWWDFFKTSH